uniref:Uncharacterized protein n=1 Tax=Peronospora matthiolae TaxID=2874970 RepID=A0AAV1T086_9STRA
MKKSDFEGFEVSVEKKPCGAPDFEKELPEFILTRDSGELSENLVLLKAD